MIISKLHALHAQTMTYKKNTNVRAWSQARDHTELMCGPNGVISPPCHIIYLVLKFLILIN